MKKQLAPIACLLILVACFARYMSDNPEVCKQNISKIACALELYACDAQSRYPLTLQALTPRYLPVLPPCPAGGIYSNYTRGEVPDTYRFECTTPAHRCRDFHYDVSHRTDCTHHGREGL